jgi:hypothetical protein
MHLCSSDSQDALSFKWGRRHQRNLRVGRLSRRTHSGTALISVRQRPCKTTNQLNRNKCLIFETSITRINVKVVILFTFSHLITLTTYACSQRTTKCPNQVFCVWLVNLHNICVKYMLETWFSPNEDIRNSLLT